MHLSLPAADSPSSVQNAVADLSVGIVLADEYTVDRYQPQQDPSLDHFPGPTPDPK